MDDQLKKELDAQRRAAKQIEVFGWSVLIICASIFLFILGVLVKTIIAYGTNAP